MKNLKPEIYRQRLIVEGFYQVELSREFLEGFLRDLSRHLHMKVIAGPYIFSPDKFSKLHHGIGGFIAWTASGVAFYSWSQYSFFTLDVYSCKPFKAKALVSYVKDRLKCSDLTWCELNYES